MWPYRGQTAGQGIVHLLSVGDLSFSMVFPSLLRLWPKFIISIPARGHVSLLPGIKLYWTHMLLQRHTQKHIDSFPKILKHHYYYLFSAVLSWVCFKLILFLKIDSNGLCPPESSYFLVLPNRSPFIDNQLCWSYCFVFTFTLMSFLFFFPTF